MSVTPGATRPQRASSASVECPSFGVVECDNETQHTVLFVGWCMTEEISASSVNRSSSSGTDTSSVVIGMCPYLSSYGASSRVSYRVPTDPANLSHVQCGHYKRRGFLCHQCMDGHGPSVYSFDQYCSDCSKMSKGLAILLYILLEVVPVLLLFIALMFLRVSILSGPFFGYVIFCQYFIVSIRNDKAPYDSILLTPQPQQELLTRLFHVSLTLSSVWNLLFFRFVVPPFCIAHDLRGVHLILLRYLTAFLPLGLVSVVYVGLEANLQTVYGLRQIHRILHKLFSRLDRSASSTEPVIRVFATFILMSISLITYETHSLILTVSVYNSSGHVLKKVLFSDPSIETYTHQHMPYLVMALTLAFLFILCPAVLLIVYPTPLYTRLSHHISHRKQIVIKIFAETFQESFKDGLNGTRDFRMFPGLAILSAALYIIAEAINSYGGTVGVSCLICGFVILSLSLLIAWGRPCKTWTANTSLSFHFFLLGVWILLFALWREDAYIGTDSLSVSLVLLPLIPHIMMLGWLMYKIACYLHNKYGGGGGASCVTDVLRRAFGLMRRCSAQCWRKTELTINSSMSGSNDRVYGLLEP